MREVAVERAVATRQAAAESRHVLHQQAGRVVPTLSCTSPACSRVRAAARLLQTVLDLYHPCLTLAAFTVSPQCWPPLSASTALHRIPCPLSPHRHRHTGRLRARRVGGNAGEHGTYQSPSLLLCWMVRFCHTPHIHLYNLAHRESETMPSSARVSTYKRAHATAGACPPQAANGPLLACTRWLTKLQIPPRRVLPTHPRGWCTGGSI